MNCVMVYVLHIIIYFLTLDIISYSTAQQLSNDEDPKTPSSDHFIKVPQNYLDFPWHVAIYDTKKKFVCSGVIISPHLVLSASHCFYNEMMKKSKADVENYEIVVSKVTVDYSVRDNEEQKAFKINKILFTNEVPPTQKNNYANDIVILILEEPIAFGAILSPVCLDWTRGKFLPLERTYGTVVGITTLPDGNFSKTFQLVNLPFISLQDCLKTLPEGIPSTLTSTSDKFCAGFLGKNADEAIPRGSGAGLVFLEGSSYYVRGLLNSIPFKQNNIAAFTDLTKHVDWISKVRNRIEKKTSEMQNFTCGILNPVGPHGSSKNYWYIPKK